MKKIEEILWGVFFIAIGIIIGLNALGITDINIFFDGWWTLFIIVPCFIGLFKNEKKMGDIIGLIVGVVLLLSAQGIISIDVVLKLILPVVFIIIGVNILVKNLSNGDVNQKIRSVDRNSLEGYCTTFASQKIGMQNVDFKGANLDAIFGSIELSLDGAHLSEDRVINATAVFGGITIIVPNYINVKVKSTGIFGGVSNSKKATVENAPIVYINASAIFGGVTIK